MHCRACDKEFQSYLRTVTLEDGEKIRVEEDLCAECRKGIYQSALDNPQVQELELFLASIGRDRKTLYVQEDGER